MKTRDEHWQALSDHEFDLLIVGGGINGCGAARDADALRPLWDGASRVVFNGDVAEVHHPEHWAAAARELLVHTVAEGVELYVAAASSEIQAAAEASGTWSALLAAGARPLPAGQLR